MNTKRLPMKTSRKTFDNFPDWVQEKWQNITDLLAETIGIPAALIMKTENESMEVLISSHSGNNPYTSGGKEKWHGGYCETVIKTQKRLLVPDATKDKVWDKNPHVKIGMIAYLGFPINFPDNQPFGTLCILDKKARPFTLLNEKLLQQFKNVIELDLALLQLFELKTANVVQEISDHKLAEEALKESEEKYRMLSESFAGGVSLFQDNKVKYISEGNLKMLGYEKHELSDITLETIFSFIHDDDVEQIKKTIETAYQNQTELIQYCFRIKNKHGNYIWIENKVHLEYDSSGNHLRSIIHSKDITERKLVEKKLQENEDRYLHLSGNLEAGIVVHAPDTSIIMHNSRASELLGLSDDQMKGKVAIDPAWKFVNENNAPLPYEKYPVIWIANSKKPFRNQVYGIIQPGKDDVVWVMVNGFPELDSEGNITEIVVSFIDITKRKQVEDKLRLKNFVFDVSIAANSIADINGIITEANDSFLRIWGFQEKDEVIGKPIAFFINDPDMAATIVSALNNTGEWEGDYTARKKDGSTFIANGHATVVKDESGELIAYQSAVIDTTSNKQAEEALQDSEKRFRNVLQDVKTVAVQGYAPDGTTTYWNKASELLYGFTAQEALGRNLVDLIIPSEMKDTVVEAIKWMAETGQSIPSSELLLQRKDGSRVSVYSHHTIVKISERPQELFCIDIDLTDRKQAEDKLKVSEQLYRSLFDQANEGLILLTMDGKIAELNQSFAEMHGYTVEEMKNMDIKDLDVLREAAFDGRDAVMQRIYNGEVVRFEVEHFHKNGHSFFMSDTASLITIAGQQYFLAFHQDITERKQAEHELIIAKEKAEESDKLKSAFLANMSHEIRTPMNGILGFAELLTEPGLSGEQQQQYIKIIERSGNRMLNIINEIVEISKIEAGLMKVDIKDTDINEKIEFTYAFFKPEAEARSLKFFFKNTLPTKEATIKTDSHKIYSILTNLVKNAIKYTDSGFIEFGYTLIPAQQAHTAAMLQFYVKDTGIGIPKNRQEAIFERFIQADITDMQARQGAGLGLSIAKAYVEMIGGKIWVESEAGIGSTFYFTLPYTIVSEE